MARAVRRGDTSAPIRIQLGMVRRAVICQKLEPMPRLILRILNRAGIAHWFRDFEGVVIRNEPILRWNDEPNDRTHYSEKALRAALVDLPTPR
jgi:hypothetical protein